MEATKNYDRQIAIKTTIQELLLGNFVKEDEQAPNYLLTNKGKKIYRLNIMGIVLNKEKQGTITNLLLDDGTGKITLRIFEENEIFETLNVGEAVLVIGKLRVYNQEKYIAHEIIKKVNHLWLKIRSSELKELMGEVSEENIIIEDNKEKTVPELEVEEIKETNIEVGKPLQEGLEKVSEEKLENEELLPMEKIKNLIKEFDQGEGVLIEELISKSLLNDTEQLIEKMLENGDIFQNLPGKVKVL